MIITSVFTVMLMITCTTINLGYSLNVHACTSLRVLHNKRLTCSDLISSIIREDLHVTTGHCVNATSQMCYICSQQLRALASWPFTFVVMVSYYSYVLYP